MSKAQISIEYLIMLSVTLAMVVAGAYVFVSYTQSSKTNVENAQINVVGNSIIKNAESLYSIGNGSWIYLDVTYPPEIQEVYVADQVELVIIRTTPEGTAESVFFSNIPLKGGYDRDANSQWIGNITPGKGMVKIESKGDYVFINATG